MTAPNPQDSPLPAWERRFRAGRIAMPVWATDAPDRCLVVATHEGVLEMHSWSPEAGLTRLTARSEGTAHGEIDPSGEWIWWFDDAAGNEHGIWRKQPFGSAPGADEIAIPGLEPSYSAGLALGRGGLAVIGQNDDGYGTRIQIQEPGRPLRLIYEHTEDAGVGGLSEDGTLLALAHSEHGDSRHTALRVLAVSDGSTVADLWDGPGKSLEPLGFAPVTGDPRLLVLHERRGRGELLVWDAVAGTELEVKLDVLGEISDAEWFRDASALLVSVDHEARTRLYTFSLVDLTTTAVGQSDGTVMDATTRPGGEVWALWSSAALPAAVRNLHGDLVLAPPGDPAPASVPLEDVWVDGPGGRIHALLRRPVGATEPLPLLIDIHGGPTAHDGDWFRAYPSAWVDHGFAVLQVNYRGSTGYGSQWRDALEKRVGHIELEDVVAVRDHLVEVGVVAPDRVVLAGASWGGYLTLLGLGLYPDRWAVGVAGVPVADYLAAYEDEMEALKAFDRSLFGGSPDEVPEKYRDSSPITYAEKVAAPVLVLAGENDPRCPIRQIENYVGVLAERGAEHEVYRYDAGHGSLVDDERVRQVRAEINFVRRHLPA
ncbi:prolyl oligopeptidase family serine peptidase [Kineosporia mesophila]|uniref:Prolyl oligopeptidase family serine peptidase n=1 Tax=Kineosporia mesophila TaxID=566012 RepID=A0ABP7AIF5_9ACTN|nr:prolyl oligopeptidase family serine peptidase [Kineosporia mesophila]MCD5350724.1 prolyl oligopeptidase family serine peptidase [Kineosporia mesophila]